MFKLASEEALLAAFRPKDRDKVELPPGLAFPAIVRGYTAWSHPAGGRVYLVFATPGGAPTGIVFDSNGGNGSAPQLCDWCHSGALGSPIALLTARRDANSHVGVHVCADLGCKRKLEEEAERSGRNAAPALARLLERMGQFASQALRMDLTGTRR